eukprot:c9800_g1_i1.p1 GENE.c9800_g1_i1~~c9800_g1_i1.p1  ORF type:complete len:438 (+),score=130.85 c9800_g1_i1:102-1415(+)
MNHLTQTISGLSVSDPLLDSPDLAGIANFLKKLKGEEVIVMTGAGVSVSAGIPDFRTPGTGLYDNLHKYNLTSPEDVFHIEYFKHSPDAFYTLCKGMWPDNFSPTPTHYFIRLLHEKGLLLRCYTQNIDSLEARAGIPQSKVVAAHGNFDSVHCIANGRKVPVTEFRDAINQGKSGWQALNEKYGGLVKPDVVFFGESLPARFFQLIPEDFEKCKLLIVMGTSLVVQPFASLIGHVSQSTPRLLINRTKAGESHSIFQGFQFSHSNHRDALFLGDCDEGVRQLAAELQWTQDFDQLIASAPASAQPRPASADGGGSIAAAIASSAAAAEEATTVTTSTTMAVAAAATTDSSISIAVEPEPQTQTSGIDNNTTGDETKQKEQAVAPAEATSTAAETVATDATTTTETITKAREETTTTTTATTTISSAPESTTSTACL